MSSYRKRPWLNPTDQSQYAVKAIHAFNVDLDGSNWYKVEWWEPHNGRPWPGGNFTWQREAVLVADGARKPIREFWNSLKAERGKTKQGERKRILAENKQWRNAQQSPAALEKPAITHKKPSTAQKNPAISQKKPSLGGVKGALVLPTRSVCTRSRSSKVDNSHTKPLFKTGSMEAHVNRSARLVAGHQSDAIPNTADDTTSEFSSANSESGLSDLEKAGFNQNDDADAEALRVFTGEESVENGVVVGESAGSEDDVLREELCHGSEEMPNCDEQTDDVTASDYRRILTPDFEPSSRRAKEFQLPLAKFTRGVSAFADLRASVTKCFHGEDDEADQFLREMTTAAWEAKVKGVELQDDPDLDDVFTDDENDPRIAQPSFKWDLQAGCTLEQFWEAFRANPVKPGGAYDWKAFWEKYCRDRGLPVPQFEEFVDCEQPEEEEAGSGSETDANADDEVMDF